MTGTYAGQFVMEGFINIKLPVYQRVLITRSIAIVPALCVAFLNKDQLVNVDTWLNILQSVQLPFALIPTLKFVSDTNILGQFALPKWQLYFASFMGVGLFMGNFAILFDGDTYSWYAYVIISFVTLIYAIFIYLVIREPVKPLNMITTEELEDHEYERLEIVELGSSMTEGRD